jgi:hypothetical protein
MQGKIMQGKIMLKTTLISAALLLASANISPAIAAENATKSKDEVKAKDKVTCQYIARTGSYIKQTKVCKTKENGNKLDVAKQAELDRAFRESSLNGGTQEPQN